MKPTKTYTPGVGWHEPGGHAEVTFTYGWVPMAHRDCPPEGCSMLCRVARAIDDAGTSAHVPLMDGQPKDGGQ